jgi:hypothetical protein
MTCHIETLAGMKAKANGNIHNTISPGDSFSPGSLIVATMSHNWHGSTYSMPHFNPIVEGNATIREKC